MVMAVAGHFNLGDSVLGEMDIIAYMSLVGGQRTLTFGGDDRLYTKNTIGVGNRCVIPELAPGDPNAAMAQIQDLYTSKQNETAAIEAQYTELCGKYDNMIANASTAEELNQLIEFFATAETLFDAKARAKKNIMERARTLGVKWDKETKCFINKEGE